MDTRKPTKTLADYLVIAVSPVLIIVMVHSVCFFLIEVFYRGEGAGGVRWVLFWFVLAVVLIARIGIEQGDGHAMAYGLALALATWLYLAKVQPNVVFGAFLLGVVWFTAHKLTCNCTLIDEEADASGQGLLQSLRRVPRLFKRKPASAAETAAQPPTPSVSVSSPKREKPVSSQIPGVWLIYFSLAALPIFGVGQMLLPAGDFAARREGFVYLFLYLAAALGLLVTTSFLGLRRYLRQRYVVMPPHIAFGWVRFGAVGAAMVLCLSLLLPRPGAGEAWGTLRYHVDYQLRRASEYAARFNPHGAGPGRAGSPTTASGQQANNQQPSGPASNPNQNQNSGAKGQGNQQTGGSSNQGTPTGQTGNGNPRKTLPTMTPLAGTIFPWVKVLFWLIAAAGLLWLLVRYWALIGMALRSAWSAILNFIAELFGWLRPAALTRQEAPKMLEAQPFKAFKNPFLTGEDRLWSPEKLIIYSYDALQSWAIEEDAKAGSPQTPREFCRRVGGEMPEAADALAHLAFLYGHVAYGGSVPANYQPEYLRLVWDFMSSPRGAMRSGV
ncbi:MAG TPA: DUF4129 domain-containing protein [Verrucomicrobiae bacterium]|nr:DUF4129 domain-containing protein [Verrucomicrobiae bacterium]